MVSYVRRRAGTSVWYSIKIIPGLGASVIRARLVLPTGKESGKYVV